MSKISCHCACALIASVAATLLFPPTLSADSLSLLADLQYEIGESRSTDKITGEKTSTERKIFSQRYSLDLQKEIMPNLQLSTGVLFNQDLTESRSSAADTPESEATYTVTRPYLELQLNTPLLRASTGYRKSAFKESSSQGSTAQMFVEEFNFDLGWKPIELPKVELRFTRTLTYDEPLTNDQQVDSYQLRSKYNYGDFNVTFNHTTNDLLNKLTDFRTLSNAENGTLRFNHSYLDGAVAVNSSVRASYDQIEFSGVGDRLVPVSSPGTVIGSLDDSSPLTSDPDPAFALSALDLLVDSPLDARPLSVGLDFGAPIELSRLFIDFVELGSQSSSPFAWALYIRDNQAENWVEIAPLQVITNPGEGRFEFAFATLTTRYIKIVTTPLAPPLVSPGEELLIKELIASRSLPADTSQFSNLNWAGDLAVNWKHSDKTSTGYDFLYREEVSTPLDEKKSQLNTGFRLVHKFNKVLDGNLRLQRSESRESGETPSVNSSFSSALSARYLPTFNQRLSYSYSHQLDKDGLVSVANAVFLRSNFDLYRGLSLYIDNGYSWQEPAEGGDSNATTLRLGSNIVPNRWMNFTLTYGTSWTREAGGPSSHDQDGRLVFTWVPTRAISLSADFSFTAKNGATEEQNSAQRYFFNWSPFRDGSLSFSTAYGQQENSTGEKLWTLSPTLNWQVNPKSLLKLDYALGERDDLNERVEFQRIALSLRVFY